MIKSKPRSASFTYFICGVDVTVNVEFTILKTITKIEVAKISDASKTEEVENYLIDNQDLIKEDIGDLFDRIEEDNDIIVKASATKQKYVLGW